MEDFSSPPPPPADITDESDRDETEEENNHDNVFGVRPYLFQPIAEAGSAAGGGQTQVHPDGC